MASANETPRQKMIGMMYLVLTALLALNVNSAILQKFKLIDDSLVDVNAKTDKAADGTVKGIQEAVAKNRNQSADQQVLKQSEEIREKTKEMVAYIDQVREKLIAATENSKAGEFHNMEATDKVAITMLGGAKNGLAYPLKDKLNGYADYIKQYVPDAAPLALDAKVDPKVTDKEQKGKNFAEFNFENTPVVAALAVLSQKETEVLKYQADALQKQAEKVGAKTIVFDKLGAFASAESNTVAAGTKYKAELFLTAAASGLKQNMTYNGSPLSVDPKTNHGKIEFTARPGNFDAAGNAKASWTGSIRINQNGRDTTFRVTVPYTVTKPVMQIQSASVQALYYKCGNKLSVQVPALGAQYQPSFSASGASVITGQKGEVTLVPNAREVTLNVSSGGNAIGSQEFKVRPIPNPTIDCYVGGQKANEKQGTPGTAIRTITLRAVPDPGFATFLPEDARYRVSRFTAVLARGKRPVIGPKTINGAQGDMSDMVNAYKEGDRLYIEVLGVQRNNFQGQVEDVNMPTRVFNIPLQ
ncbi:gliding motility protein GldM [Hymenobacter sp. BT559]|jgi:gliding motility-associated protein GldM|uniref:type IX secretion system motor protein PorM/GldM n=1 Tax=Hymenobacter sp. BT559 TaxID=2795729 RepID=UPI0018EB3082|nr:gliding motility protein GldM [Hymenobacter sp. BT559]MBJ6144166.1 gliding motility protein GldM [Hymenobacter sp. BT559]